MSAFDFSHSPSVESVIIGLNSQNRFDLVESASLETITPAYSSPRVDTTEGGDAESFDDFERSESEKGEFIALIAHNSNLEAQEIAGQKPANSSDTLIKKGLANVASPSAAVGTDEALVRFDQNGDGHIDQTEVQTGIRAEDESSTFAALSQYKKSLELYQKITSEADIVQTDLFEDKEIKVEKMFDDENLDQDLYEDQPQQTPKHSPEQQETTEVVV